MSILMLTSYMIKCHYLRIQQLEKDGMNDRSSTGGHRPLIPAAAVHNKYTMLSFLPSSLILSMDILS